MLAGQMILSTGGPCYQEKKPPYKNNGSTCSGGEDHVSHVMLQAMVETPYSAGNSFVTYLAFELMVDLSILHTHVR